MDLRVEVIRRNGGVAALGLMLLCGAASAQTQTQTQTQPAAESALEPPPTASAAPQGATLAAELAAEGRRRYTGLCARCHGLNLVTVGIGFDLRTFPQADKERFVRSVTQGVRAMPAFGNVVQAAELEAIWAYIGSVNGWGP